MEYLETEFNGNKRRVILHYQELKEDYLKIKEYSNEEFKEKLLEILHTTCIICHLKEIPSYNLVGDCGLIHEIVHVLNNTETFHSSIDNIREMWNSMCKLA